MRLADKSCTDIANFKNLCKACVVERLDDLFRAVDFMDKEGLPVPQYIFHCLLPACSKKKDLAAGRKLLFLMVTSGQEDLAIFGDHLIRLFTLCGSFPDANLIFSMVTKPSVYTWQAIISATAKQGDDERALDLYNRMQHHAVIPNKFVFSCILKACSSSGFEKQGKLIHDHIIRSGVESDLFVVNGLVDMYAKCGNLKEAQEVFDNLPKRDVVSWSALISGYVLHMCGCVAIEYFKKMHEEDIKPNTITFLCSLKACGSIEALGMGRLIHGQIITTGFELDANIGNTLVDMYAKCGSLEEADTVFVELAIRDDVSWGAMVSGYAQHGYGDLAFQLFEEMQQEGVRPNKNMLIFVLRICGRIGASGRGKQLHDQIIRSRLDLDMDVGNTLIDMYAKCQSLEDARAVFDELLDQDVVSWGTMISAYAQNGNGFAALELYEKTQIEGLKTNKVLLSCSLKACGSTVALSQGKLIHSQIIRNGLELDSVVGNSLVDMYAKCESLMDARKVFDDLPHKNLISWGAMIAGYVQNGQAVLAFELFEKMQQVGMKPNRVIISCMLLACSNIGILGQGKLIHECIIRDSFESDLITGNTLIYMYIKCNRLDEAENVFDMLQNRDVVSWGGIIVGCAQHGHALCALEYFETMQKEGINANVITFIGVLKACGIMGAVVEGKFIHHQMTISGLDLDKDISSALVDMYGKSGSLEDARNVFDRIEIRDVVSRGAMTAAYIQNSNWSLARQFLEIIQGQGLKMPEIVYISILSGCSHTGDVNEGKHLFKSMTNEHGITASVEHYNCMVDLLCRAGYMEEAKHLLQTMPILPAVSGWMSLLTACRTYGNTIYGRGCFDEVINLDSNIAAGYVLMSNIYAESHLWEDVLKMNAHRKSVHAWKKPGRAWIEVNKNAHEFLVSTKSETHCDKAHAIIKRLICAMKEEGYLPGLESVLQ